MSEQQERAINAAERLSAGLQEAIHGVTSLREDMDADRAASEKRDAEQAKYSRMTRIYLLIAAIGLLFDITGTTLAVVAIVKVAHNSATIADIHQSNLAGCRYNNTRLAKQEQALDSILAAAQAPASASQRDREASAAFELKTRGFVAGGWGSRDCTQAYKLP